MSVPLQSEGDSFANSDDQVAHDIHPGVDGDGQRPTVTGSVLDESQELHPLEPCEKNVVDWILGGSRCAILLLFVVSYVLVFINVCRGTRLKNWRLYCVVSVCVFLWLGMALYVDHIDECTHLVHLSPQRASIYMCFHNLLHGLSLYLCLLLLSHLSDFQHRGVWLWLVGAVVFVPLIVTITILIIDLKVPPAPGSPRYDWKWTVGIAAGRLFFYNVLNVVLLLAFSPRFCTGRLYGTYSERRSTLTVTVSRWTFAFLLLHHLATAASFAATVIARTDIWQEAVITHRILDEVAFLLIVLCVPMSYLVGVVGQRCCGARSEAELEMEKMDKIYQEVWTTNQEMKRRRHNGGPIINTNPNPDDASGNINRTTAAGGSNLSIASSGSSNNPTTGVTSAPDVTSPSRNPNGSILNGSRASSIVTLQASPGSARRDNAPDLKTPEKRRNRESYFEAVSMGSLQGADDVRSGPRRAARGAAGPGDGGARNRGDRASVTSEPIDL